MAKYHAYNTYSGNSVTVNSTSIKKAIAAGRKRLPKGTVRAYRIK